MKRAVLIVPLLLLLLFAGCKENEEESFVEFFLEWWNAEVEYEDQVLEKYGWTHDELEDWYEELSGDTTRAGRVVEKVRDLDTAAADSLSLILGLTDWGYVPETAIVVVEQILDTLFEGIDRAETRIYDRHSFWRSFPTGSYDVFYVDQSSGVPILTRLDKDGGEPLQHRGSFFSGIGMYSNSSQLLNPSNIIVYESGNKIVLKNLYDRPGEPRTHFTFGGPRTNLQPAIFGDNVVVFSRENEDGGFDLALWTESSGVIVLDLGPGDQMWPTFYYAAGADRGLATDSSVRRPETRDETVSPINSPSIIVYQNNPHGVYGLYYAIVSPGGTVYRYDKLLDFPGEALCPKIPNNYPADAAMDVLDNARRPRGSARSLLAFHSLIDGNRDIYLGEVIHSGNPNDHTTWQLAMTTPRQVTDWPNQERFPTIYTITDGDESDTWCFFAANREGNYNIYAYWLNEGRFYQLTNQPGLQTAPFVLSQR